MLLLGYVIHVSSGFRVNSDIVGRGAFFVVHGMDALGAHGLLSTIIRCLLESEGEVGDIFSAVWHWCSLWVSIEAVHILWTFYLHTWVNTKLRPLLASGCGFRVVLVGNLRVHVCFWEPCIFWIEFMEPTTTCMYFTWFSMFRVWWEWALLPLMWWSSDCIGGVRGH